MKTVYISDLQTNELIEGEAFAIFEVKKLSDKNSNFYYDLLIGDKTGKLRAKVWSEALKNIDKSIFSEGKVLSVWGKVDEFKGVMQINIKDAKFVDESILDEFMKTSAVQPTDMFEKLLKYTSEIQNKHLKVLVKKLFEDEEIKRKFIYWPAAKSIHHDFRGGLLQHVLEMIEIAFSMKPYYPSINWDIVLVSIILHDIGKIEEIDATGISIKYTKKGSLVGHICISVEIFERFVSDMPEDLYLHIKHIILSHHGELQFGSPVNPSTSEALIVANADRLSSKTRISIDGVNQKSDDDDFSNYIPWLENTRVWDTSKAVYEKEEKKANNDTEDLNSLFN